MTLLLRRTVRFSVNAPYSPERHAADPAVNGYAGAPPMDGLGRYYEIDVLCRGDADPVTGYLLNIKDIDAAVRRSALPIIVRACRDAPRTPAHALLPALLTPLDEALSGRVRSLVWRLTPYYCVEMSPEDRQTVLMRQRFDFAASHRLHSPGLSDQENRASFGKCNNPGGHGHNYQVEPCIAIGLDDPSPPTLAALEGIVDRAVIARFDHKNFNTDVPEFAAAGGLNPSVENIARVSYDLLERAMRREAPAVRLRSVTVWETDRTCCTYPA